MNITKTTSLKDLLNDEVGINQKLMLYCGLNFLNREKLLILEKYCTENVLPEKIEKKVHSFLKKQWLKNWNRSNIVEKDYFYIKKYFEEYSFSQQSKLDIKIKNELKKTLDINIKPKIINPLTEAIDAYKLGDPELLFSWVKNKEFINFKDGGRIFAMFEKDYTSSTLSIATELLRKHESLPNHMSISSNLIKNSLRENNFIDFYKEFINNKGYKFKGLEKEYQIIYEFFKIHKNDFFKESLYERFSECIKEVNSFNSTESNINYINNIDFVFENIPELNKKIAIKLIKNNKIRMKDIANLLLQDEPFYKFMQKISYKEECELVLKLSLNQTLENVLLDKSLQKSQIKI